MATSTEFVSMLRNMHLCVHFRTVRFIDTECSTSCTIITFGQSLVLGLRMNAATGKGFNCNSLLLVVWHVVEIETGVVVETEN